VVNERAIRRGELTDLEMVESPSLFTSRSTGAESLSPAPTKKLMST
jgi:hypothetical protein